MSDHFVGRHVSEKHATSLLRVRPTVKMEVAYVSETVLSTFNTIMYPNPPQNAPSTLWKPDDLYCILIHYIRAAISEWNSDTKHMYVYACITIQRTLHTDYSCYKR
jgi:hypothetical protein